MYKEHSQERLCHERRRCRPAIRRSVDSIVSAFVVGDAVSSKFLFWAQFDVDLMPDVLAHGDCFCFYFAGRLVWENVSISHRDADDPNDPPKIFPFLAVQNT